MSDEMPVPELGGVPEATPGAGGTAALHAAAGDATEALVALFDEAAAAAGVPFDRSAWRRAFVEAAGRPVDGEGQSPADIARIAESARHAAAHCPVRIDVLALTPADAIRLVRPNAPLALLGKDEENRLTWALVSDHVGRRIKVHGGPAGGVQWMTLRQLCSSYSIAPEAQQNWLALQPMFAAGGHGDHADHADHDDHDAGDHPTPLGRLLRLLRPDRSDITVILVYALAIGLLALSTPIAVEALVNTVAFGQLLQPVVVLAAMLAVFLGFAAAMRALQTYTAEIIQRRIFVRLAGELVHRLPRVRGDFWRSHYGPELINRFFEVVTVQKVTAQLLLDGTALALQSLVGMVVIAFYHPAFLGFNVFLALLMIAILFVLGRGAVSSAIQESRQKYATAAWLEEIARSPFALSAHEAMRFAIDCMDRRVAQYLSARAAHFRILMRQIVAALALQVVASTVLLGLGGWLVIRGELSLGQLVAAELIVTVILGSFAKVGKHLEGYYDLMAAVEKLGHLLDMPVEPRGDVGLPATATGAAVSLHGLSTTAPAGMQRLERLTLEIKPGELVALTGGSAQLRTAALATIGGRQETAAGRVEINGLDLRRIDRHSLRDRVALVKHIEMFTGTVADNVHVGRASVCEQEVSAALRAVRLLPEVLELPQGVNTVLVNDGGLSRDQRLRLMLARAVAGKPQLLLIDGALDAMPDEILPGLLADIRAALPAATILVATGRRDVAAECDRAICVADARAAGPAPSRGSAAGLVPATSPRTRELNHRGAR